MVLVLNKGDAESWLNSKPGIQLVKNSLKSQEFEKLLARLDPNRDGAAAQYEVLRRKLIAFFQRNRVSGVEELADETIDRIAKKLDTEEIHDLNLYAYGVARNVCLEIHRRKDRLISIEDHVGDWDLPGGERNPEDRIVEREQNARSLECLQRCLVNLPSERHRLIVEYYKGEKQSRIKQRQDLAKRLGVSIQSLRNEANTIRDKLRRCVIRCVRSGTKQIYRA